MISSEFNFESPAFLASSAENRSVILGVEVVCLMAMVEVRVTAMSKRMPRLAIFIGTLQRLRERTELIGERMTEAGLHIDYQSLPSYGNA